MDWMQYWELIWVKVGVIMTGALLVAAVAVPVVFRVALRLSSRTTTDLDDRLARLLRGPVGVTPVLLGAIASISILDLDPKLTFALQGVCKTFMVLIWGVAAPKAGDIFLAVISEMADRFEWIQPKTLPLFQILWKVVVFAGVIYLILAAWHINVTTWLASAGVVGIAVGFAAKDTLANLFSGVFILADAPYKLGDYVVLGDGLRGRITDIGVRSTRLLTRDDIEVTVPNAVIGNAQIVNQTGGPHEKMRLRVSIQCAYGADIDQVREVLLRCANEVAHVSSDPPPQVRFRSFGESGLDHELRVWIEEPAVAGRVLDNLNTRVYKAFQSEGIEIPFPQRDVHFKGAPPAGT